MIASMTGFGKSSIDFSNKKISIQLKSLNSKRLDIYARIPSEYKALEIELHKMINEGLSRGKVDFTLAVETGVGNSSTQINRNVVQQYIADLKNMTTENIPESDLLKMAISLPEAVTSVQEEIDQKEFEAIKTCLKEAIQQLNQFRADEGKALEKDFRLRIANLHDLMEEVKQIDPERISALREKLTQSIEELKVEVDQNRFEQELIYYIEKYDITEEITRLTNHLEYFLTTLESEESNGRKLGFITQEMGREINTIGSKSNDAKMQKAVVQMKDELEKIKEQILNVL